MSTKDLCVRCGLKGKSTCSRCKAVRYCGASCQREHWKSGHKGECKLLARRIANNSSKQKKELLNSKDRNISSSKDNIKKSINPLFPFSRMLDLMTFKTCTKIGSGLINAGNNCFANSVLQVLSHTAPLQRYLLFKEHSKECVMSAEMCILCILEEHIIQSITLGREKSFFPRSICASFGLLGDFQFGRQEDAHEFIHSLLQHSQQSLLRQHSKQREEERERRREKDKSALISFEEEDTTVISQIFSGQMCSVVKCTECGKTNCSKENFYDLNLELSFGCSVEEALDRYTSIEDMDISCGYRCSECNKVVAAKKQITIERSPNVLFIHLKRFDVMHGGGKINKSVVFREELDIKEIIPSALRGEKNTNKKDESDISYGMYSTVYDLYGVIVHYGRTIFTGHYVAFVKCGGVWYLCDDKEVIVVNQAIVLKQNAYMLFYQKRIERNTSSSSSTESLSSFSNNQGNSSSSKQRGKGRGKGKRGGRRGGRGRGRRGGRGRGKKSKGSRQYESISHTTTTTTTQQGDVSSKNKTNDNNKKEEKEENEEEENEQTKENTTNKESTSVKKEEKGDDGENIKKETIRPKYKVFCREGEKEGETFLEEMIVEVDLAMMCSIKDIKLVVFDSGKVILKGGDVYQLGLHLPFLLNSSKCNSTFNESTGFLLARIPIYTEEKRKGGRKEEEEEIEVEEKGESLNTHYNVIIESLSKENKKKEEQYRDDWEEIDVDEVDEVDTKEDNEKEEGKEEEGKDVKSDVSDAPLPFMDPMARLSSALGLDEGNEEKASYNALYKEIRELYNSEEHIDILRKGLYGDKSEGGKTTGISKSRIKRNDPCTCGSGKKYKHCHMISDMKE